MRDQAEDLRLKLKRMENKAGTKTLAVVSGKGGVGKSNFSLNFSLSLSKRGYSVLLFDMDIGMGNLDILMGTTADHSIVDFFEKNVSLKQIITEGPKGLHYIAGGTGLSNLVELDEHSLEKFTGEFTDVLTQYDYVILDMGAGISEGSLKFILSVQEVIVVTTPEPTSITDAYSIMKYIHLMDSSLPFYIMVNRCGSENEGKETYKRLATVLKKFLNKDVLSLGMLPDDRSIVQAVKKQIPFLEYNAKSPAAKAIEDLTNRFNQTQFQEPQNSSTFQFVSKLKKFLFER